MLLACPYQSGTFEDLATPDLELDATKLGTVSKGVVGRQAEMPSEHNWGYAKVSCRCGQFKRIKQWVNVRPSPPRGQDRLSTNKRDNMTPTWLCACPKTAAMGDAGLVGHDGDWNEAQWRSPSGSQILTPKQATGQVTRWQPPARDRTDGLKGVPLTTMRERSEKG
jgi:hypothetical protein